MTLINAEDEEKFIVQRAEKLCSIDIFSKQFFFLFGSEFEALDVQGYASYFWMHFVFPRKTPGMRHFEMKTNFKIKPFD